MKRIVIFLTLVFVVLFASAQSSQPNIVFILVDDMGWGDLGIIFQNEKTGKRHLTPELDALIQEGVHMVSHYCPAPICAPSRASLYLGQHQGHAGVRDKQFDKALPDQLTIGSAMQEAGYRTAMVGKYGLQGDGDNPNNWPAYTTKRGFSEFFGYPDHRGGHLNSLYHDWPIGDKDKEHHRNPKKLWHQQEEISGQLEGCYTTDLFTAFAKKWIVDHRNTRPEQPFMLMLTYDTPHAALQVATGPYPEGKGLSGGVQWLGKPGEMINTAKGEIDSYIHPDYRNKDWTNVEQRFVSNKLYQAEGLLKVSDDSEVVLHLETKGQVVIKIHDNVVINHDDPTQKSASDSYELNLAKGYHPIRIYAKDMGEKTDFVLSWTINSKRTLLQDDFMFCQY